MQWLPGSLARPILIEPAVTVEELAANPAALGGTQEGDEVGAIDWQSHSPLRIAATELGDLLVGHPASIRGAWLDDVRCDASAVVTELLGGGENDGGERGFACSVREVAGNVIARECNDTTEAVWAAEAPAVLTYKEPRCTCVHREMSIEAVDRCVHDVGIHRFGVGEDECGDWSDGSLDRVEDMDSRIREAEIGLNRGGLDAERVQLIAQPRDVSWIAAPRHALVVGTPECDRDVPALSSESQRDSGADALPPAGAGDQR